MRFIAGLLFAAIVACGIDFELVRQLPDFTRPSMSEYDRFLMDVRRRTPPGASIAIDAPAEKFHPDYADRYYRASYELAGRRVIPLKDRDDRDHRERIAQADYVAVWDGKHGTLQRRSR